MAGSSPRSSNRPRASRTRAPKSTIAVTLPDLKQPSPLVELAFASPPARVLSDPPSSDVLGRGMVLAEAYRIRELIGSGGMGQVYEADDVVLNRRVAIKVPWPASDPSLVKWEAQALAAIHHPALPAVYAVGRHGTIPFVVMERIYGRTLRDHLDQCRRHGERFSLEEALNVMTQLAEALAAVHRSGIAHRDIKPGNVVLAPGNRVVILDFGLVLPEFAARGELAVAGSPAYMAPEAIRVEIEAGRAHLVDIYALGVLSYELLTGDKPFQAEPTATATMSHHLVTPVPDLGSKSPAVPRDVALLVHSMLSKDPAERPPSAEHLARELHRVRFGAPHAPGSRRLSVLIAEDDANISSLLALWVRKAAPDADIRAVSDGESALSAVRASPPDLMLLDLNMPRMNGVEVCMYLRGTRAAEGLTIVSVSASAQEHDLALLRTLGVANFVAKGKGMGTAIARVVERIRPGRAEGGAQRRK